MVVRMERRILAVGKLSVDVVVVVGVWGGGIVDGCCWFLGADDGSE